MRNSNSDEPRRRMPALCITIARKLRAWWLRMVERRRQKKRMRKVGSSIIRDFFGGDSTNNNSCLLFVAPSFASDEPTHARSEDEQNEDEKHDGTTINPVAEGAQWITTKVVSKQTNKSSNSAADITTGERSLSRNNARTMALSSPPKHQLHRYSSMYTLIDELLFLGNAQEKSGSVRTDVQARDDRSHSIFSTVTPLCLFDDETGTRRMYHLTSLTPPSIVLPTNREWAQYSKNMAWSDFHFTEQVDGRVDDDDDDDGSNRKQCLCSLESMRGRLFPPIIESRHHSSNKKSSRRLDI